MAENKTTVTEEIKDYSSMKKAELLELAKEMGAKVNTKTRKADIIAAIEAIEAEAEEAPAVSEEPVSEAIEEEAAAEAKEEVPEEAAEEEITEVVEEVPEEAAEEEIPEVVEEVPEEAVEEEEAEAASEAAEEVAEEKETAEPEKAVLTSTERKRKMKAERREAKAARKEANKIEEKKKRPSNLLLAILIFGVLIGMFLFIGGYNYFSKPASIEKYMDEVGMADMYTNVPYDEHSTITVRADGNTIKMLIKVDEDLTGEHLEEYTSEDATEDLKAVGAQFLTSLKPEARGFGGEVKVGVKQGDETINYVKLSYSEAKKLIKDLEKKAEEESEAAEEAADEAEDAADEAGDEADD